MRKICAGYKRGRKGTNGQCICGLYWEGEMPFHYEDGTVVPKDKVPRVLARMKRQSEINEMRRNTWRREKDLASKKSWRTAKEILRGKTRNLKGD